MIDTPYFAWGVALAALSALVATSLSAWIGRRGESPSGPRWGAALGMGVGALIAHEGVREALTGDRPRAIVGAMRLWWKDGGTSPLSASDAVHGLPWAILAATLLGLFDGDRPAPRWARWENRVLITGLLLRLMLGPLIGGSLEGWSAARWMIGLGLGIAAWWGLLDVRAEALGRGMTSVLLISALGLPPALLLAHAATRAMLAAGFAAVVAAVWLAAWGSRRLNLARGAVPTFAVVFAGLILDGMFSNDLAKPAGLLLALAPLASFVDRIGPVARLSPWARAAVRIATVAIVAGCGVGWAYWAAPEYGY